MPTAQMIAAIAARMSAFFAAVARLFMPPFHGLPFVMGCYFVISYCGMPHNPIWLGDLPDPDDYTYLSQTLDWLQGQNWFDNVQHRMNPPDGVPIHYSRLAELPIAAAIMLFRAFHHSWQGAALLASFLLPIVYLGFLFAALRWVAVRLVAHEWANLSCFIVLFADAYMFKFAPGQVDHHGLEGILTIVAVGMIIRAFAAPERLIWAAGAAAVLAVALAIALEILPWLALIAAIVGLWTVVEGARVRDAALAFAVSLLSVSAVLLALEKAPADFFRPDILAYSITYVALTAGIAVVLGAAALATRIADMKIRLVISGAVAISLGALYLHHYPALIGGPYGAMNPLLAKLFFANLEEAQPLLERFTPWRGFLGLATAWLGLGASLVFMRRAEDGKKWAWGLFALLLSVAIALAVFYQVRVLLYAQLFAVVPLTHAVQRGWRWIGLHCHGRRKFWAEIVLLLAVGPLTAVLLPAVQDGRSFNTGVLLFPARSFDDSCGARGLAYILDSPPYAARAPLRVVTMMDAGPELLFRTPHAVLSAPYHTNVRGNLDAFAFLSTTDDVEARNIARRDGINLVALCRQIPDMYLAGPGPHYVELPNGEVHMRPDSSLAGRLAYHKAPDWLAEIPLPPFANYLLFAVK